MLFFFFFFFFFVAPWLFSPFSRFPFTNFLYFINLELDISFQQADEGYERVDEQTSEQGPRTSKRANDDYGRGLRTTERTDERTNERTSERTKERTNGRANGRMNGRANGRMNGRANGRTDERTSERTSERRLWMDCYLFEVILFEHSLHQEAGV